MVAIELALFPWEEVDALVREQAEAEVWSDEEHDAWLAALAADQMASIDGNDPMYERWLAEGAPSVAGQWSLLPAADDDVLPDWWRAVDVLPDWQRDEYVGS